MGAMPTYSDDRILPYPPRLLYDLVADVERYPLFVPGWQGVRVIERSADGLLVQQTLGAGPIVVSFRARAALEPPTAIRIEAVDGPFRTMRVQWRFAPDAAGTRLYFLAQTEAAGPGGTLLAGAFAHGAPHILAAFLERARRLHEHAPLRG